MVKTTYKLGRANEMASASSHQLTIPQSDKYSSLKESQGWNLHKLLNKWSISMNTPDSRKTLPSSKFSWE